MAVSTYNVAFFYFFSYPIKTECPMGVSRDIKVFLPPNMMKI